ncbi:hypothetical protein QE152_g12685 [Popillia japonica]|uniref:Uncharacterized protein n=1 Tax=Popillia japonica TaxID=7064 RepID=A0AAW1LHQ7_POPJA
MQPALRRSSAPSLYPSLPPPPPLSIINSEKNKPGKKFIWKHLFIRTHTSQSDSALREAAASASQENEIEWGTSSTDPNLNEFRLFRDE